MCVCVSVQPNVEIRLTWTGRRDEVPVFSKLPKECRRVWWRCSTVTHSLSENNNQSVILCLGNKWMNRNQSLTRPTVFFYNWKKKGKILNSAWAEEVNSIINKEVPQRRGTDGTLFSSYSCNNASHLYFIKTPLQGAQTSSGLVSFKLLIPATTTHLQPFVASSHWVKAEHSSYLANYIRT